MKKAPVKAGLYLLIAVVCFSVTFVAIEFYQIARPGLIVLLYHKITEGENIKSKYDLSIKKFTEQIRFLKKNGYSTILPTDLIDKDLSNVPEKSIIISFDDGTEDHYHTVLPILKENEYSAVFFVVPKYLNYKQVLKDEQVKEMSQNGMEIGSHSFSHPFLETLNQDDLLFELKESKERIEEITSTKVVSFAPPGGWYNENVVETAEAVGYKAFFSCEIGKNSLDDLPFVFKRIEVLGNMTPKQFEGLLEPSIFLLGYKIRQSIKFFLHDTIGIENYLKLGGMIKKLKFYSQNHNNEIKYARS